MSLVMTEELVKLVRMAGQGDMSAMRRLYDINKQRILKLALNYSRNREDAEEIVQETFIKAFTAIKKNKLRREQSFPFWLNRIGINTSIDWVKKHGQIQWEDYEPDRHSSDTVGSERTPEHEIIRRETVLKIERALQKLSSRQRVIFTMKHFQHFKIREIAESLGCSEGNVKQQLFRSVRRLRDYLAPELGEANNEM